MNWILTGTEPSKRLEGRFPQDSSIGKLRSDRIRFEVKDSLSFLLLGMEREKEP